MKKLTKSQRFKYYVKLLKEFEDPSTTFYSFCHSAIYLDRMFYRRIIHIEDLPEILAYIPKRLHNTGYWFSPHRKTRRISILKEIIANR